MNLIIAMAATVILEVPVVFAGFKRYRPKNIIVNAVLVNLITNMTLNLLRNFGIATSTLGLLVAETVVIIVEIGMYYYCTREAKVPMKRILLTTVAANAFSFSAGFIFWGL